MKARSVWPALSGFASWAAVAAGGIFVQWQNRSLKGQDLGTTVFFNVGIAFVFAAVGAFIAYRSRHIIGWLLLAVGIAFPLGGAVEQYALYGLVTAPESVPGTTVSAVAVLWVLSVAMASLVTVLLLFPTGTVRSPRWKPVLWAVPISVFAFDVGNSLTSNATHGPWSDHEVRLVNPLARAAYAGPARGVFVVGAAVTFACSVAGIVSIVLRFRASRGVERQQIKWLAYVGIASAILFAVQFTSGPILHLPEAVQNVLFPVFFSTLMFGIPLSIGAAILRYRLYDIDRVISRTLSYAIVTALLVGAYAGLVVVFQATTRPLLGRSDLAVAASTLIVAALFIPVRRRVQSVIDHRFNRRRYDAERTIDTFAARLRDEVDIDTLGAELIGVVRTTMAPTSATLWLKAQ